MATTMTLDGTSLPLPIVDEDGHGADLVGQGAIQEMADGSAVLYHSGTSRLHFKFSWRLLSAANYAVLKAKAETTTAQTLKPPDTATTYSVVSMPNTFKTKTHWIGGLPIYSVDWELMEVTA